MKREVKAAEKEFGKDMKAFEQLSAKTKELLLLEEQAEKATGQKSAELNRLIRDKSK